MTLKFPSGVGAKAVAKNHNAVCCDSCKLWEHIKCNNLIEICYRKNQISQEPWYCKNCIKNTTFFQTFWKSTKKSYKREFNSLSKENNSG